MTFKELYDAACNVDPDNTVSVEVSAWRHVHKDIHGERASFNRIVWLIFSGKHGKNYEAATPEDCLKKYMAARLPTEGEVTPDQLSLADNAGEVPS